MNVNVMSDTRAWACFGITIISPEICSHACGFKSDGWRDKPELLLLAVDVQQKLVIYETWILLGMPIGMKTLTGAGSG